MEDDDDVRSRKKKTLGKEEHIIKEIEVESEEMNFIPRGWTRMIRAAIITRRELGSMVDSAPMTKTVIEEALQLSSGLLGWVLLFRLILKTS